MLANVGLITSGVWSSCSPKAHQLNRDRNSISFSPIMHEGSLLECLDEVGIRQVGCSLLIRRAMVEWLMLPRLVKITLVATLMAKLPQRGM